MSSCPVLHFYQVCGFGIFITPSLDLCILGHVHKKSQSVSNLQAETEFLLVICLMTFFHRNENIGYETPFSKLLREITKKFHTIIMVIKFDKFATNRRDTEVPKYPAIFVKMKLWLEGKLFYSWTMGYFSVLNIIPWFIYRSHGNTLE